MGKKEKDEIKDIIPHMKKTLPAAIVNVVSKEITPPGFADGVATLLKYVDDDKYNTIIESDAHGWQRYEKDIQTSITEGFTCHSGIKEARQDAAAAAAATVTTATTPGEDVNDPLIYMEKAWKSRWLTFSKGADFQYYCTSNVQATIDEMNGTIAHDLSVLINMKDTLLNSYDSLYIYKQSLSAIINSKLKELNKNGNKIDTYNQNLFIDERKDLHEKSNYEFYKSINFYIILFYYSLLICYFIFSPFFKEKKYKNYLLVSIIILYIFLPLILPHLLAIIYNIYLYILESNNLRDEIISYPYIIEDREKYE